MKVKVSFHETTVVVPCGNGEEEVRSLFDKAAMRFKKATGKSDSVVVEITALHTAADDAVVDPDDIISDVLDDKDKLIAIFTVLGDVLGGGDGGCHGARHLAGSSSSNVPSSTGSTPSPFSPTSLSPSPVVDPHRRSSSAEHTTHGDHHYQQQQQQQHRQEEAVRKLSDSGTDDPAMAAGHLYSAHGNGRAAHQTVRPSRVARPEPPPNFAPTTLPDDPAQSTLQFSREPSLDSTASTLAASCSSVSFPAALAGGPLLPPRSPNPSARPSGTSHGAGRLAPRRSPGAGRHHSGEQSVSEEEEDDEVAGMTVMHRKLVPTGARASTMKPTNFLINRWQRQEAMQQQQWSEHRLTQTPDMPTPSASTSSQNRPPPPPPPPPPEDLGEEPTTPRTRAASAGQQLADIELSCRGESDQLGVFVRGYRTSDDRDIGVFVREIRRGSIAAENGLIQVADRLVSVNGIDLTELSNNQAVALFQSAVRHGRIRLQISRAIGCLDDTPDSRSPSPPPLPGTSREARERELAARSEDSVGSQPPQQPPAAGSGAATPGGTSGTATSVQQQQAEESASAVEQVQQRGVLPATNTLPSVGGRRVVRKMELVLLKAPTGGLGFSVTSRDIAVGDDADRPVFVKAVTKNGVAFRDGRLRAGDRLLDVDGASLTGMTQKEAVQVLVATRGQVTLTILREEAGADDDDDEEEGEALAEGTSKAIEVPGVPTATSAATVAAAAATVAAATTSSSAPSSPLKGKQRTASTTSASPPPPPLPPRPEKQPSTSTGHSPHTQQRRHSSRGGGEEEEEEGETVLSATTTTSAVLAPVVAKQIKKHFLFTIPLTSSGSAGLGISVKGKTAMTGDRMSVLDQGDVGHGIYIKSVLPGGAAAKDGRLLPSDRLVSINGENLSSLSDYDAFESLRHCMAAASQRPSIDLVIERYVTTGTSPQGVPRANSGITILPPGFRGSVGEVGAAQATSGRELSSSATTSRTSLTDGQPDLPRERSIEGDIIARPSQPPSSTARQHAMAIQQQLQLQQQQQQQGSGGSAGSPSPVLASHHQHLTHLAVKKHSNSDGSTDSGVGVADVVATETDQADGSRRGGAGGGAHGPSSGAQQQQQRGGGSKADSMAGRGYQATPTLRALKIRNAAATTTAAATAKTPDGASGGGGGADGGTTAEGAASGGGVKQRHATRSPVTAKKAAWRSSMSKSSNALMTNAATGSAPAPAVAVPSNTSAGSGGLNSSGRSSGRGQTLVELVSDGLLTGGGAAVVSNAVTPGEGQRQKTISPSTSSSTEPTKVSVRAVQVDPPTKVVMRKVEAPIFTKSPTEDQNRCLDSRPDSAPPISHHKVFVSGQRRYEDADDADDRMAADAFEGSPQQRRVAQGNEQRGSPVVMRKGLGVDGSSPAMRRDHAMSAMNPHRGGHSSTGDEGSYEEDERRVHYNDKLKQSELPVNIDDFSRYEHGKYPAVATLPRKKRQRQKLHEQRKEKATADPANDGDGDGDDSLADAETLTGRETRSRAPIWLPDHGDGDAEGGVGEDDSRYNTSFDEDELGDSVPMLTRTGPGRRSMSERRHTALDPRNSEFYVQLKEKKKAGKSNSDPASEGADAPAELVAEDDTSKRLSTVSQHSHHRRAASLESLQTVLGGPDITVTDNISNSPKARRLLGIHGDSSSASSSTSNGAVKPAQFQRRQSYEKSPATEEPTGLGGELVGRPGHSNTIQFGSKPAYSSKKAKKLFPGLSFLKTKRRPRGMPAPLTLLQTDSQAGVGAASPSAKDSMSVLSSDGTDTSSISSMPLATRPETGEQSERGGGAEVAVGTRRGSENGNGLGREAASPEAHFNPRHGNDDGGDSHSDASPAEKPRLQGSSSEIQLRGHSSMDYLRDVTSRSGSADDVRTAASAGGVSVDPDDQLSPTSPPLTSSIPVILRETI